MTAKYVECIGGALDGFRVLASSQIYAGYVTTLHADNGRHYAYRYDGENMQYVDDVCMRCGKVSEAITYRFEGGDMDGRVIHNTHLCGHTIKVPLGSSSKDEIYRVDGARLIFEGLE